MLGYYQHPSQTNHCDMRFAVYVPPQAARGPVPVVYYLAGLTCNEETFVTKACALEHAALGPVHVVGLPVKLSATPGAVRAPPPAVGAHTRQILAEAGYAPDEVEGLLARRVVA